jgi:hypothetical protein
VREQAILLCAEAPKRKSKHERPFGYEKVCKGNPPGVPFSLHLMRRVGWSLSAKQDGILTVSRFAPPKVEEMRSERLRRALDTKLPKLFRCKQEGATSVLVLEDDDIALTNEVLIGDALQELLLGRADIPDQIYLVETCIDAFWTVWPLMRDGIFWPDDNTEERFFDFGPDTLIDLTGR